MKILVVDDHRENLVALRAMLLAHDCQIIEATSGAQALKGVLAHDLALILLDVVMPQMDGFETARLIRAREASRHIPIIFLTASGDDIESIYRGYSVGAVDYLVKPIDPDILKTKVSVFTDLFKKGQRLRAQEEQLREAERLRSAAALLESETLYEATFEAAAIGIAHADTDGRWLRVNQKLCDITGYSKDELLRMRCQDITHPDDVADTTAAMQRMLAGEQDSCRLEKRYERKNGGSVWVNLTASLLLDATGKPKHFIKIIEDVSERRLAREREQVLAKASAASAIENAQLYRQAQDAVRARDEFLHIASHELRTPLTPLQINFRRLLGERSKEPLEKQPIEKVRSTLARCDKQLQRLVGLVENLLDVTRISSGHFQLEPQSLDLVELTRDVIGRFSEELGRANCTLSLDAPAAVNGRWDRLRLEQVVTNLLSNAIKYGAGTPIEVVITEEDETVAIHVRDQGIGIAPDDIPRLFERFERAASARSYGGLGLGLYIVRQIVQAHGGTIQVSSAVGVGSLFMVSLPTEAGASLRDERTASSTGWSHPRNGREREAHAR